NFAISATLATDATNLASAITTNSATINSANAINASPASGSLTVFATDPGPNYAITQSFTSGFTWCAPGTTSCVGTPATALIGGTAGTTDANDFAISFNTTTEATHL